MDTVTLIEELRIYGEGSVAKRLDTVYSDLVVWNWFKGADTTVLTSFLQWRCERALADYDDEHEDYLQWITDALQEGNLFMAELYWQPFWLKPSDAARIAAHGKKLLFLYSRCASYAFARKWTRYKINPKFHMLAHLIHSLQRGGVGDHETVNPIAHSVMDEDFVGKVSTLTRSVSPRLIESRTLQRYLVCVATRW
ncbi:unnamed protein product [Effrenium voratum]|nr:unnamed protein product [Effrenium voratum]